MTFASGTPTLLNSGRFDGISDSNKLVRCIYLLDTTRRGAATASLLGGLLRRAHTSSVAPYVRCWTRWQVRDLLATMDGPCILRTRSDQYNTVFLGLCVQRCGVVRLCRVLRHVM
jgi:hypothetical protein